MNRTIEAIYRNGVLHPLQPLDLPEELRVILDIHIEDTRLYGLRGQRTAEFPLPMRPH